MSIFVTPRKSKGPFIATQRLLFLNAPPEKRRTCLEPARFRSARRRKGRGEPGVPDLPRGCQWLVVRDREKFLSKLTRPRLCLLVDAGVGKTTALQQTQYLRSLLPGHMAMGFRFSDLPAEAADYLDAGERSWLPLRFGDLPGTRGLPPESVRSLIQRKIRQGNFTLVVDALDQTRSIADGRRDPHQAAKGLAGFLAHYPEINCIVSGRPYSIVERFWNDLFQKEDWEYAQVDFFSRKQQKHYVGSKRWRKMQQLGADTIAIPRMLETVRDLKPQELDGVRTAADLYWRAMDDLLKKAFEQGDLGIARAESEKLFGLLAMEMHQADNFVGVAAGSERFVLDLFHKRRTELARYANVRDFEHMLGELGRVNEVLDFAVLQDAGQQQFFFRDRTLQDFFAALWLSRYADNEDRRWLNAHLHLRGHWGEHLQEENRYEFWKLMSEMPPAACCGDGNTWVPAISILFLPNRDGGQIIRSTEMMYRAWWGLMQRAGSLGRKERLLECHVQQATTTYIAE